MSSVECLKSDPMKNDLVLQNIFKFCDIPSLKNIRLVSSKWKDLSLKVWRQNAVIRLEQNGSHPKLDFLEFLKLINPEDGDYDDSLQKYPFKKYSLELEWTPLGAWGEGEEHYYWEQKRVTGAIFNSRARHVKVIWVPSEFYGFNEMLSMLNSDSLESFEVSYHAFDNEAVPPSTEPLKCSKVKRLKIYTEYAYSNFFLSEYLLKCFPKLEALSVSYNDEKTDVDYPTHLADRLGSAKQMKSMRLSGGDEVLPLKELEIIELYSKQEDNDRNREEMEIINTLAECKFPLERLSIHVGWHGNCNILILPLLESCKKTLQYLKTAINFNDVYFSRSYRIDKTTGKVKSDLTKPSIPEENVFMEVLEEVHLVNGLEWALFLFAHVDTPELKKLIVEYENDRNHVERYGIVSVSFPLKNVYEKLETFQLLDNHKIPGGKLIRRFARMMPNLTHLTIPVDKKTFPLICQHFKGLKTLHILEAQSDYVELDDEGLTGVTKAELEKGEVISSQPNITDLEHLTDLNICCQRMLRRDDIKFTEHSVMYGFLRLPRLYNLSVSIKELSEELKEKLLSHVKGHVDLQRKLKLAPSSFDVEMVYEDHSNGKENTQDDDSGSSDSE